jgi:hypothetical protein
MKLQELAVPSQTKQAAKVFESYFGDRISFETLSRRQARTLLNRVRGLVSEHRRTPEFHRSEQNPAYMKLIMLEQVLSTRVKEEQVQGTVVPAGGMSQPGQNPQQQAGLQQAAIQQHKKQMQEQLKQLDQQAADIQKQKAQIQQQMNNPAAMAESRRRARRLREASEIQQAQVVLASQDMVDQVQKMSEQVSAMQFKDLPALIDQIKNEVGVDQAMQFNTDATAALAGLLQNLQGTKTQLEQATGVVTGQAPVVPGEELGAEAGADIGADIGADLGAEMPPELPAPGEDEEELPAPSVSLGRGRR